MIPETLSSLLHHCSKIKAFRPGLSLHAAVFKTGIQSDIVVSNHVLNMYAKCGDFRFARKVFDEMSERNLVSWSAMISGYDQAGESLMAIHLFSQMEFVPNEYVFASAISSCARLLALIQGQQIHAKALKFGYGFISFVSNSLISMYMKCGRCNDALSVHNSIPEPNSVSFNALLSGLFENNNPEKGFEVFKLMYRHGLLPDQFTFVAVLGFSTINDDDIHRGTTLHGQTIKLNFDTTPFIGNVIITMYSRLNLIEEAEKSFSLIKDRDIISWNTLISACSHCDDHVRGLKNFRDLTQESNIEIDEFTFASVLSSCAGLASIRHGKQVHAHLVRTRLHQDLGVGNALVNMYAKCGSIAHASRIFNRMIDRNLVSWNTIITGFGNHGIGSKSIQLFNQMKDIGLKPDSLTFTGLLIACNHAGLVDKGKSYFNSMENLYGIKPNIEHFSCLIDLLGRAGKLTEAEEYTTKFKFGNDPIVLGSLLSACRLHGNVVIGEKLAKRLVDLAPVTTSPYVLLSNLYAHDGLWSNVVEARRMMKGSGLKKEAGHSLIEVKGVIERFTIRDFSHVMMDEILAMLGVLSWESTEIAS